VSFNTQKSTILASFCNPRIGTLPIPGFGINENGQCPGV